MQCHELSSSSIHSNMSPEISRSLFQLISSVSIGAHFSPNSLEAHNLYKIDYLLYKILTSVIIPG